MSQQGGRPTGHEDDWWAQLYDGSAEDTGPTAASDSLDDRFVSATETLEDSPDTRRPSPPPSPSPSPSPSSSAPPPPPPGPRPAASSPRPVPPPDTVPDIRPSAYDDPKDPAPDTGTGVLPGAPPPAPAWWQHTPGDSPAARTPVTDSAGPSDTGLPDAGSSDTGLPAAGLPGAGPSDTGPPDTGPPDTGPPAAGLPPRPAEPTEPANPGPPMAPTSRASEPAPRSRTTPAPASTPTPAPDTDAPPEGAAPTAPAGPRPQAPEDPRVPRSTPAPSSPSSATVHLGSRPPVHGTGPIALPLADPEELGELVPDTVLEGAGYGTCTLRAVSVRGDSARHRGEPRRDALLVARFGTGEQALVLVAMATGARTTPGAHRAAAGACQGIAQAVGRSHARLVEDIRAARRGDLKAGLHRLTDRSLGRLRVDAVERGLDPEAYTATLRCLLLPADPECRTRIFFGVGPGGLFRLRGGEWHDIEPRVPRTETPGAPVTGFGPPPPGTGSQPPGTPEGDQLTMNLGITTPPNPYDLPPEPPREPFRFRASPAQPGDTLLMCTAGLADPLRGEPELCARLARRWSDPAPPDPAAFLADTRIRGTGYADDRTAAAVWEA